MSAKSWKVIVYESDDSTVDFTITDSQLAAPPVAGGQRVDPLRGRAETIEWAFEVVDTSDFLTGELSDGDGRLDVLGRLVDVQLSVDGGAFSSVQVGRISHVGESEGPGLYAIRVSDERWVERGTYAFEENETTCILPPGTVDAWLNRAGRSDTVNQPRWRAVVMDDNDVLLQAVEPFPVSDGVARFLEDDLIEGSRGGSSDGVNGKFEHLRITVDGTQRQVTSFNSNLDAGDILGSAVTDEGPGIIEYVWVVWPSGQPNGGAPPGDDPPKLRAYIHAPTAPTSATLPRHLGGTDGFDPFELLKDEYEAAGIRIDTDVAFADWDASTNPHGLIGNPKFPRMHQRLTSRRRLDRWAEETVYGPLGVVPFVNADGEISPRSVFLPQDVDPTTATEVTGSDVSTVPTWMASSSAAVTRITFRYRSLRRITNQEEVEEGEDRSYPTDLYEEIEQELPSVENDRTGTLGIREHVHDMPAVSDAFSARKLARWLEDEIFHRYGDGQITGDFSALSSLDGLSNGDLARINVDLYPDINTGTRGGTRVVQILSKSVGPAGPEFSYLDAGPELQPLSAPTVSISQNATAPKFAVDVTISGLSAGESYALQIKVGSAAWRHQTTGTTNETVTVEGLPSNTTIQAQARATKPMRISSAWSTVDSVATAAMSAPSGLSATVDGGTIILTWTNGEADQRVMPVLDGTDLLEDPLPAGTTRWVYHFSDETLHTLGVKHVDPWGGESATTTLDEAPDPLAEITGRVYAYLLQGEVDDVPIYPEKPKHGVGVEFGIVPAWPGADVVGQYDTDSAFSDPTWFSVDGSRVRVPLPPDGTRRYFRFRHEQEGSDDGKWSSTLLTRRGLYSAIPVPFGTRPVPNVDEGRCRVLPRWRYIPEDENFVLDLRIIPERDVRSVRISLNWVSAIGDPPASPTFDDLAYDVNLATAGEAETFRVNTDDGAGNPTGTVATWAPSDSGATSEFSIARHPSTGTLLGVTVRVTPYDGDDGEQGDGNAAWTEAPDAGLPTADSFGAVRLEGPHLRANAAGSVSGTWAPNHETAAVQTVTLIGDTELQTPSNLRVGETMVLEIDTNGHALTFAAGFYGDASVAVEDLEGVVGLAIARTTSTRHVVGVMNDLQAL